MRANQLAILCLAVCALGGPVSTAEAKGTVTVTFTTTPAPQRTYTPANVVAVWIRGPNGAFIKTLGRWSAVRTQYLLDYIAAAGPNEILTPDAITGASRLNHTGPLTVVWNLRDRAGNLVPDGTYTIRLELAESNATTIAQNNEGTFTVIKGLTPQTQTNLTNGGFINATVAFDPNGTHCGDGVVDAPEKCDPGLRDSCPASSAACVPLSSDRCEPTALVGNAADCTAECVIQPITACNSGDGCCPAGCDGMDSDCTGNGGGDGGGGGGGGAAVASTEDVVGGCAIGTDPSFALALIGLALLLRRRAAR